MSEGRPERQLTAERLREILQDGIARQGSLRQITSLTRRASQYRSSYPLEEIELVLDDGACRVVMAKDLHRDSLTPAARAAKPDSVYDPCREIEVYRSILAGERLGTAHCYAAVADDTAQSYWLFVEKVPGVELYQVGELEVWQRVAGWLADFHAQFEKDSRWRVGKAGPHLVTIDRIAMQGWFDRALSFANERRDTPAIDALAAVGARWGHVVDTLAAWPHTLLHGEFYPSNVLVDRGVTPMRVSPVDWEMAAAGPGLIDLAALVAGNWQHDEPARIVDAYVEASARHGKSWARPVFDHALTCARAYVAVQWLGWSRDWTPPEEHRQDWAAALARSAEAVVS